MQPAHAPKAAGAQCGGVAAQVTPVKATRAPKATRAMRLARQSRKPTRPIQPTHIDFRLRGGLCRSLLKRGARAPFTVTGCERFMDLRMPPYNRRADFDLGALPAIKPHRPTTHRRVPGIVRFALDSLAAFCAQKQKGRGTYNIMNAAQMDNLFIIASQNTLAQQLQDATSGLNSRGVEYNYHAAAESCGDYAALVVEERIKRTEARVAAREARATAAEQAAARTEQETAAATTEASRKATYADAIMGRIQPPKEGPGKLAFQVLMVGGMVSFMATLNGIEHAGLEFFTNHSLWMYPLVFCIAMLVRTFFADKLVGFLASRYVAPRFKGLGRNIAMTLLNVAIMSVVMSTVVSALISGASDLADLANTTMASLPATMTVSALVNFFIVGPTVKVLYHNVIAPTLGINVFRFAQKIALPGTVIFGS